MRGLLIGVDVRAGSIIVARHGYPPLPMKVAAGAAITRDGAPAKLSELETGSQTSVPDALLVTTSEHAQRVKSVVDALRLGGSGDVL